ncbi:MAG: pyridoxal-phosphate dependent enzyme [Acidobacteria bacterium]|nr:pyridoxal-phosphate dependent enzyme [Acidobacteriota bacterium]
MSVFGSQQRVSESILESIGKTPLIRLRRSVQGLVAAILAKVESSNPGGSTKDRVALNMIEQAEKSGVLRPGGTIIEATAGNTGLGLALVGAVRGYRCIFVLPDKMSEDKIRLLRAYGAEVVITPTAVPPDSTESYNGVANRLAREIEGAWRPDQFHNIHNPKTHYQFTAPEIWEQTKGKMTVFVAAAGTGGTVSGVGEFLKEKNPKIRVIGADIEGSILSGDSPKPWKVEGIGEDFVPQTLNAQVIDEWIRISDAESFATARRIAREEGILLGGSSGTALAAAFRYAQRCTAQDMLVVFCPDTGRNYLSKMYDNSWMAQHGFTDRLPESVVVGDLLSALGREGHLISLTPENTLKKAADLFRERGISQIPILERGEMVGAVEEITIMRALRQGSPPEAIRLREIMAKPLPRLDVGVLLEEVYRLLMAGNPAVVAVREGRVVSIITRSDLMSFYQKSPQAKVT